MTDDHRGRGLFWGLVGASVVVTGLLVAVLVGYLIGHFTRTRTRIVAQTTATMAKQQFAQTCASCHTLAAAGATGAVGPNLDQLKPGASTVAYQITHGGGAMPAYSGQLSTTQIQAIAAYVSTIAGSDTTVAGGATTSASAR